MNREEAKQLLNIIQALADGKAIQHRDGGGAWADVPDDFTLYPSHGSALRIKPEPKLRPWTRKECPQCFIVRCKRDPAESRIAIKQYGYDHVRFCSCHGETSVPIEFNELARDWERVLENGDFVPCGVMEEA